MNKSIQIENEIRRTSKSKIHAQEFSQSLGHDNDEILKSLQILAKEHPELGTFNSQNLWFDVNPEIYNQNRKQLSSSLLIRNSVIAILLSAIGFLMYILIDNISPIVNIIAGIFLMSGITFFFLLIVRFVGDREQEDKTVGAGVISLIGGSNM